MKNNSLKMILRAAAALLAAVFVLCACGCTAGGKDDKPEVTEAPATELTLSSAQQARVLELAAAFRQYGEFKNTQDTEFSRLEYIVFCMFTDKLNECEVKGFGKLSSEEADAAIFGAFGEIKIMDVMRRKYDAEVDQTYYFKNGSYYIMRTDNSAYSYRIISAEEVHDDNGVLLHEAVVLVQREGTDELYMTLTLVPEEAAVYRVSACGIQACR